MTGDSVLAVTLTFTVALGAAPPGADIVVHSEALAFEVVQMVNEFSIAFASGAAGLVMDARGGEGFASGSLAVAPLAVAGLFAFAPLNELVNAAPLGEGAEEAAAAEATRISGVLVFDRAGASNGALAPEDLECSTPSASLSLDGCAVMLGPNHAGGSPGAPVSVRLGSSSVAAGLPGASAANATAVFRVWFPSFVALNVSSSRLGVVLPLSLAGDGGDDDAAAAAAAAAMADESGAVLAAYANTTRCPAGPRFQRLRLSARATFTTAATLTEAAAAAQAAASGAALGGEVGAWEVDVSALVAFSSSDPSVLAVRGLGARGVGNGSALVAFASPALVAAAAAAEAGEVAVIGVAGSPALVTVSDGVPASPASSFPSRVTRLDVVVVSGAAWGGDAAGGDLGTVGLGEVVAPLLRLEHALTSEGAEAMVAAYAHFEDGTWEDVSTELVVSSESASLGVTAVPAGSSEDDDGVSGVGTVSGVVVEVGALSLCGRVVVARWAVCGGGGGTAAAAAAVVAAEGRGLVFLDMPAAVSVTVAPSSDKLAAAGDGASLAPFSTATSVSLIVTVGFDDGSVKDFSNDARCAFSVSASDGGASAALVELAAAGGGANVVTVRSGAIVGVGPNVAVLEVSFPGAFPGLTGSASVAVVALASVEISTLPYPAVAGWSRGDVAALARVACTGVYQRLEARASGTLTDGTARADAAFYSRTTFAATGGAVLSAGRVLAPPAAGRITLTATFGGLHASVNVSVSDAATEVTGLSIANDVGSPAGTLSGLAGGAKDVLAVTAAFSDGTALTVASSGQASSAWLQPSSFLAFASSAPVALAVSGEGVVTLGANHPTVVSLTASDACGSGVTAVMGVSANLAPAYLDIDLGFTSGPALGAAPLAVGGYRALAVRVQASATLDLTLFQVVLSFDATKIVVAAESDCSVGTGWASSFECTVNDPVSEVLLAGSCGLLPSSGCKAKGLLTLATVTFTAVGEGDVAFTGRIVKLKDDGATVADVDMVAGAASLTIIAAASPSSSFASSLASASLSGPRRFSLRAPSPSAGLRLAMHHPFPFSRPGIGRGENTAAGTHARASALARRAAQPALSSHLAGRLDDSARMRRRRRRRLGGHDCAVLGDTNGDCSFDVEDVQFLQYFIGGAVDAASLSAQQLQAMDPDLDGDSDGVDIAYLMKVVANKYRFLSNFTATSNSDGGGDGVGGFGLSVAVWTGSSDAAQPAATAVWFELGTASNRVPGDVTLAVSAPTAQAEGTDVAATDDGLLLAAAAGGPVGLGGSGGGARDALGLAEEAAPGTYLVVASFVRRTEAASASSPLGGKAGVVVVVATLDALGGSSDGRTFAFYCTRLIAACAAVFGDSPAAFQPFATVALEAFGESATMSPSPLRTAGPSLASTPRPSLQPTPAPTSGTAAPTSGTHAPTPTPPPAPRPTAAPSPAPTAPPAPAPSARPLPRPTPRPTPTPAPRPTLAPTALPSSTPTGAPTLLPSAGDAATARVSLTLTASALPTAADRASLRGHVASGAGVGLEALKNFEVVATARSVSPRRFPAASSLLASSSSSLSLPLSSLSSSVDAATEVAMASFTPGSSAGSNRRLTTYDWALSVDVSMSLSGSGSTNPLDFAGAVAAALSSPSFQAAVVGGLAAVSGVSAASAVAASRRPTNAPSGAPTQRPTLRPALAPSPLPVPAPTARPVTGPPLPPPPSAGDDGLDGDRSDGSDGPDGGAVGGGIGAGVLVLSAGLLALYKWKSSKDQAAKMALLGDGATDKDRSGEEKSDLPASSKGGGKGGGKGSKGGSKGGKGRARGDSKEEDDGEGLEMGSGLRFGGGGRAPRPRGRGESKAFARQQSADSLISEAETVTLEGMMRSSFNQGQGNKDGDDGDEDCGAFEGAESIWDDAADDDDEDPLSFMERNSSSSAAAGPSKAPSRRPTPEGYVAKAVVQDALTELVLLRRKLSQGKDEGDALAASAKEKDAAGGSAGGGGMGRAVGAGLKARQLAKLAGSQQFGGDDDGGGGGGGAAAEATALEAARRSSVKAFGGVEAEDIVHDRVTAEDRIKWNKDSRNEASDIGAKAKADFEKRQAAARKAKGLPELAPKSDSAPKSPKARRGSTALRSFDAGELDDEYHLHEDDRVTAEDRIKWNKDSRNEASDIGAKAKADFEKRQRRASLARSQLSPDAATSPSSADGGLDDSNGGGSGGPRKAPVPKGGRRASIKSATPEHVSGLYVGTLRATVCLCTVYTPSINVSLDEVFLCWMLSLESNRPRFFFLNLSLAAACFFFSLLFVIPFLSLSLGFLFLFSRYDNAGAGDFAARKQGTLTRDEASEIGARAKEEFQRRQRAKKLAESDSGGGDDDGLGGGSGAEAQGGSYRSRSIGMEDGGLEGLVLTAGNDRVHKIFETVHIHTARPKSVAVPSLLSNFALPGFRACRSGPRVGHL